MRPRHSVKFCITAAAVTIADFGRARRDQNATTNLSGDIVADVCAGNGDGEYLSDLILPERRRDSLFSTPNYTCSFSSFTSVSALTPRHKDGQINTGSGVKPAHC